MPNLKHDTDTVVNVGQILTHWTSVTPAPGKLIAYPNMPVGGPPGEDFNIDVREVDEFTIETEIPGANDDEQAAFIASFAQGTIFSNVAIPTTSGQMSLPSARIGRDYYVSDVKETPERQNNNKLSITLREKGATAGGGSGSG